VDKKATLPETAVIITETQEEEKAEEVVEEADPSVTNAENLATLLEIVHSMLLKAQEASAITVEEEVTLPENAVMPGIQTASVVDLQSTLPGTVLKTEKEERKRISQLRKVSHENPERRLNQENQESQENQENHENPERKLNQENQENHERRLNDPEEEEEEEVVVVKRDQEIASNAVSQVILPETARHHNGWTFKPMKDFVERVAVYHVNSVIFIQHLLSA